MRLKDDADEIEQQGIDHQHEQAEGENQQRERQQHDDGPDESVENAQHQRRDKRRQQALVFEVNAGDGINRDQHREGVDQPALDEFFHFLSGLARGTVPSRKAESR